MGGETQKKKIKGQKTGWPPLGNANLSLNGKKFEPLGGTKYVE